MGRPEKPINPDAPPPVLRIAQGLRVQRHEAGLSYKQLARRAQCSASSLAAAASGDKLPSLAITMAFAGGCGGERTVWKRRWLAAHAELHDLSHPTAPFADSDLRGFANQLRALLRWNGLTSLTEIAEASRVSRATVYRALGGTVMPSGDTIMCLLNAAELTAAEQRPWLAARIRLLGLPSSVEDIFDGQESARNMPVPPRGAQVDLQQLTSELGTLRGGRGVERVTLSGHVGPALLTACGISPTSRAHEIRNALITVLTKAVVTLPPDQRQIASAALNLPTAPPEHKHPSVQDRTMALARTFQRDARTMQRRVRDVLPRLAEALIDLDQHGSTDD